MKKDKEFEEIDYINVILDKILLIELNYQKYSLIELFNKKDFKYHGLLRAIQEIGEAIQFLSKERTERYPTIQWRLIIGLRHKLAHDLFEDFKDKVFIDILHFHIPILKEVILKIKNDLEQAEK